MLDGGFYRCCVFGEQIPCDFILIVEIELNILRAFFKNQDKIRTVGSNQLDLIDFDRLSKPIEHALKKIRSLRDCKIRHARSVFILNKRIILTIESSTNGFGNGEKAICSLLRQNFHKNEADKKNKIKVSHDFTSCIRLVECS